MPQYFFDLENGAGFLKDSDGRNLPDDVAIQKELAAILLDVAGDELNGIDPFTAEVTVRDQENGVVMKGTLSFRAA
ncbi:MULTISPECIES: hypothetical protein [unclassified Rhizobium]|uniref:DUF6894 family protein n=1 Tax=unclassified Rhizobium TaxID=2613769 RepID=UPI0006FDDDC3|nr:MULTISPECIES: hypothetical protein [unclassified Rhizobium]KQV36703.1 hypothetical protein ASC86_24540 [Rhizobium sp. Root1212]KRD28521.1 hypothetical protein ASE37_24305 [Rhizobium sp. Root268]